jgi:hypothetical protein
MSPMLARKTHPADVRLDYFTCSEWRATRDLESLSGPVVFFKGKLDPGKMREVAEGLGIG